MRGPIRGVSLHHGRLTKSNILVQRSFFWWNWILSRPSKQPKVVFSRKHRAHCLNAVVGYWCKIAEHCKQILFPVITNWSSLLQREQRCQNVSIDSRSLTRADENGSGDIDISLGYRRRGRVSSSLRCIKPIPQNTTDKCPKYNPKIGPLTDLHTWWHSSYFSSTKRSS